MQVVDDVPRLSCVVTNGYSDWSTQPWPSPRLRLRVHVRGDGSFVVEACQADTAPDSTPRWQMVRIAHLSSTPPNAATSSGTEAPKSAIDGPPEGAAWIGVFGCCPAAQAGCSVVFRDFSVTRGSGFDHNADGNQ